MASLHDDIIALAARLIVEQGEEYGPAKRKAAKQLGRASLRPAELPSNEDIEDEVREYLRIFHSDTQPGELQHLREIALLWMKRLQEFEPHCTGAVWHGTATRLNDIWINLFCDDGKAAEIAMINAGVDYDVGSTQGFRGHEVDVLTCAHPSRLFGQPVILHFTVYDRDDLRGALKPDARGRLPRGSVNELQTLVDQGLQPPPQP